MFLRIAHRVSQTIHKSLYISETIPITSEHKLLYTTPSVSVILLQPVASTSTYTYSVVMFSLNDISNAMIDSVRRIAALPLDQMTMANADVFFVVKNGPENILKLLNLSSAMYVDKLSSNTNAMEAVSLGLTVGSVLLLTFVMCVLVRPPVYDVERNKENVLILFLDVPAVVVRDFQRRCAKHLNQLVASNDDNGADGACESHVPVFPWLVKWYVRIMLNSCVGTVSMSTNLALHVLQTWRLPISTISATLSWTASPMAPSCRLATVSTRALQSRCRVQRPLARMRTPRQARNRQHRCRVPRSNRSRPGPTRRPSRARSKKT